ncbi:hypothetical protein B0H17DRAFT_1079225 [Mycena rosella]|uniref:Uncharacterized protein n=1 Tax=Mycena rosella TaxID=1033263 RepID=A0AAD7D3Q0_MYCRO|nr:hypothetical protein B0H17DRAFT_1079225 [Mycena rosella]
MLYTLCISSLSNDAGVYLLHFAETFISDPLRYYTLITTKKGNPNSLERQSDWNYRQIKNFRETLTRRIEELSMEWKKNRAPEAGLASGSRLRGSKRRVEGETDGPRKSKKTKVVD